MNQQEFLSFCSGKPGVTIDHPMGGETAWLKVCGKMFAITNVQPMKMDGNQVPVFHFINLKCDPARAIELRDTYPDIRPGWHQNKTHWNSVMSPGMLPDAFLGELIDHSYALVVASLPPKVRDRLDEEAGR